MEPEQSKNGHPIAVAVVEDNSDYRTGISFVLKNSPSVECVGEFTAAEDLIEDFDVIKPDIVLMDIGLPGISGIEATRVIKQRNGKTEIVILSVFEDDDNIFSALCAGAVGYVTKPVAPHRLVEAVEQASNGGTPMSPHIARKVLRLFKQYVPPPRAEYNLTERELEILKLLTQGDDYKQIAECLFLSIYTVRAHIRNIYDKLHVHSKSHAVAKALKEGILQR